MNNRTAILNLKDNGFFDSKNQIRRELINNEGTNNLKEVIDVLTSTDEYGRSASGKKLENKPLNINQLRKFYDSFLRIFNAKTEVANKKVQLLMLKANAEYSANRLGNYYFNYFLQQRIDVVIKQPEEKFNDNLRALKLHLEALVGYFPKN